MEVYLKPEMALKEGKLPPQLTDAVKLGKFKVLSTDNAETAPSSALAMPDGVGQVMTLNGKRTHVWWVFNSDIYGENKPSEKPQEKRSSDAHSTENKKVEQKKVEPVKIKPGDIVKVNDPEFLNSTLTKEERERGFRVLDVSYSTIVVELPENKGACREEYGASTYALRNTDVTLIKSYKLKIGDYVRVNSAGRNTMYSSISAAEFFQGFKILGWDGDYALLEVPNQKGAKGSGKYAGKYTNRVLKEYIELAPKMKYRKGDEVRLQRGAIPIRIPKKDRWKKVEILDISGDFGSFRYTVKLPDGTSHVVSEGSFVALKNDSVQEDSVKIKKGMKVSIKENRRNELPDSLDTKERSETFEILDYDERDDDVLLKMPKSCTEADYDDDHDCRVWHVDASAIEEQRKEVKGKMAKKIDRSSASFVQRLQANAEQGAIKTAGRKLTKTAKAAILSGLESIGRKHGMDENQISSGLKLFQAFMESENGSAVISTFIGQVLAHAAPKLPFPVFQDERIQDLADEMSSEGMAIVMEGLVNVVLENFAPSLGAILEGLPPKKKEEAPTKTRTAGKKSKKKSTVKVGNHEVDVHEDDDHEEEKETVHVSARVRAN